MIARGVWAFKMTSQSFQSLFIVLMLAVKDQIACCQGLNSPNDFNGPGKYYF